MFYYNGYLSKKKRNFYLKILKLVKEINEIKVFRMVMVIIIIICEENKTIGFVF